MNKINFFWFRRDLRLSDNVGLFNSLQGPGKTLPIFIFDTDILSRLEDKSDARVEFIHRTIADLKSELNQMGSDLKVYYGKPEDVFRLLIREYNVEAVFTNKDYEPNAIKRDQKVQELLAENSIAFHTFKDHVIFEEREILSGSGSVYKVFTPYSRQWKAQLTQNEIQIYPDMLNSEYWFPTEPTEMLSLGDIGFESSQIKIPDLKVNKNVITNYADNRNFPAIKGTSRLGIHLRFGTLSMRSAVKVALEYDLVWLNQLIWRDFYIQVLFNFPHVVDEAFKKQYDRIPWRQDEDGFQKWCKGRTGYPIVDAGMRELNTTGYMHNRVRMIVASFLTKHLLIDWRWGEVYFASKLLDYELAANNGGWQWAAGTGTDAQPYFRVFNPTSQQEKFDPDLTYTKKWVPELGTSAYPPPMVEHKFARQRAIDTFKTALA